MRLLSVRPTSRRALAAALLVVGAALGLARPPAVGAAPLDESPPPAFHGWSAQAVDLAASLPVQEGGRVKPLASFALYTLMAFSGNRSVKLDDGGKLTPVEWLLDLLFVPQEAATHRVFRVEDDATLDAIGLGHADRAKRDWYSFADLEPALARLQERAEQYRQKRREDRDWVEEQVLSLYQNVLRYTQLSGSLGFALGPVPLEGLPGLERLFGKARAVPWSEVVRRLEELRDAVPPAPPPGSTAPAPSDEQRSVAALLRGMARRVSDEGALALLPPPRALDGTPSGRTWRTAYEVLAEASEARRLEPDVLALLQGFEAVGAAVDRPAVAQRALADVHALVTARARERGEYGHLPLEVAYHRLKPVAWSLGLFLLGSLLALLWQFVRGRWGTALTLASWGVLGAAQACLVAAIVMRCLIRSRPPVTTLYEATLFISATAALLATGVELLTRRRWPLLVAGGIGALGLYVAGRYEELTATDTMPTLVAVLDTNFWLSTHVTCVTLGYTASLLAAVIGAIHVVGRAAGLGRDRPAFYAGVARAAYGVLLFGMLFSVVGTILGGIWANESWGRFWGWDPKENGALMIVLWDLALLHARMGGHIGPHGLSMAAVFGGGVVVFSYWGVNLMGVGLHSYGFSAGLWKGVLSWYVVEAAVLAAGGVWWLQERARRRAAA